LGFQSSLGSVTQIVLDWDDWAPDGDQQVDLYLLDAEGNVLASSRNSRAGGHPPVEQILYRFDDSRTYFISIQGVNVTRPLRLDLYVHDTTNMELVDPDNSLATPGDAIGSLTVGAINWRDSQLEAFSSRGPTSDGRIKPDLVGPDGVSNAIYAPDSFYGTSAAAPHIAGAAALVWNAFPNSTADEIRQYLIANTFDLLTPGPDSSTGSGLLVLPEPPPQPTPLPPTATPLPGVTITPQPTATPRKIVIATVAVPRPRPPINPQPSEGSSLIGLAAVAIAIGLIGWLGFKFFRRNRLAGGPWQASSLAAAANPIACAYCGRVQRAEALFCLQCGRPLSTTSPVTNCTRCGRALRPGAQYCTRCGQSAQ
jgi:hypothetical protein